MIAFLDAAFDLPTVVFTALLGVVLFYWLLALVGLVDIDASGVHLHLDVADGDAGEVATLASWLVALGLNGVPFSVVVTLIVLFGWTASCLAAMWLMPLVPTTLLRFAAGSGVFVGAVGLAVVLTARAVRPLRGLFVTHAARPNASLVGQPCRVLTGSVDTQVGRAEVQVRGAGINVRVWADTPNAFTRGSAARLTDYDEATGRFRIEPE